MSKLTHRLAALFALAAVLFTIGSARADDYTFLKYLDGANDTYFNTGIVVTDTMEFRFRYAMLNCTLYHGPFSTYAGETANATRIICANGSTTLVGVNFMTKAGGGSVKLDNITEKAGDVVDGYMNYNEVRLNTNLQQIDRSAGKEGTADNSTLDLFGRKDWYSDKMRIYNFRVYIEGTLNRFYAMARRTVDNALGLYDLKAKKFYTKTGGGDFAAGPVEDGLRLSEDIYQYRVQATTDGDLGTVSINEGDAASSVEVWSDIDDDLEVRFTATPSPGCKFDHWEGDVEALTAAERSSPTLTRTLSAPFALKAVFVLNPEDVFVVAGSPKEFNTDPATIVYGPIAVEDGTELSVPAQIEFNRGVYICCGYELYRYDGDKYVRSYTSEDNSYTVTAATVAGYKLVWLWDTEYNAGSSVGPDAYVQSGLIAQFDVLCDQSDGVWPDRMGNCAAMSGSSLSFEKGESDDDPGWAVFTKARISTSCSQLPGAYAATTIEAFAYASEPGYNGYADPIFGCGQNISIWWQVSSASFGVCAPMMNNVGYYGANNEFSITSNTPSTTNTWTVQSDGAYGYKVYLNGIYGTFNPAGSFWSEPVTYSQSFSFGNSQMTLKARSLRLYSRQLSAEEVAFNAAVDNIRFRGGIFPDDLPEILPDGVRLNTNQDGLEVRVRAVVEDGSGMISVTGQTAAVSNEIWVDSGTEITLDFVGNPGISVGEWKGAPSVATAPTPTSLRFKAHGALSIVAVGKAYSENPIMEILKVNSGAASSFGYSYNIPNAGGEAKTVTLRTIYGQTADNLCYTNEVSGVIGEGGITIDGLIHSREYYFKIIAFNDEGKSVESDLMSVKTASANGATIYDGKYGTYDSRQPLVKGIYGMGLQGSIRLRGPITAPAGTRLVVHYGLTDNLSQMESVDFGSECISGGAYSVLLEDVPAGTVYVILETVAGNFNDYFHAPATGGTWKVPSYTVVAKEDTPSMHPAVVFTGSNYLQVRGALPSDTFASDFTMSLWVKNPRGISDGDMGDYDLRRNGYMMGCGTDGQGATGPMIAMRPYNWTHDTDAEWQKNPQWSLCATYRDSANVDWGARMDPTPERDITCDDKWHHIIMVCSETEKRVSLYLDLELVASVQSDSMKDFIGIGGNMTFSGLYYSPNTYGHMIGLMAEATVWKKALNEKERRLLNKNKFSDDDPALVGHWLGKTVPLAADTCLNHTYPNDLVIGSASVERKTKLYIPYPGFRLSIQ